MVDLKDEVEGLLVKAADNPSGYAGTFTRIQVLAEKLSCDKLLAACAKYLASHLKGSTDKGFDQGKLSRLCLRTVEGTPKFAAALLMALMA